MSGTNKKLSQPSPLAKAVALNNIKDVGDLLRRGADANQREGDGLDVLSIAAVLGHTQVARLLLDRGAHINARSKGATPLMKAVLMNHADTARLLIDRGADVNAATDDGLTALIYSVQGNNMEIMQLLLGKGADVSPREYRGYTARTLAEEWKREEMVPLLREAEQMQYHAIAADKQRKLRALAPRSAIIRRPQP